MNVQRVNTANFDGDVKRDPITLRNSRESAYKVAYVITSTKPIEPVVKKEVNELEQYKDYKRRLYENYKKKGKEA